MTTNYERTVWGRVEKLMHRGKIDKAMEYAASRIKSPDILREVCESAIGYMFSRGKFCIAGNIAKMILKDSEEAKRLYEHAMWAARGERNFIKAALISKKDLGDSDRANAICREGIDYYLSIDYFDSIIRRGFGRDAEDIERGTRKASKLAKLLGNQEEAERLYKKAERQYRAFRSDRIGFSGRIRHVRLDKYFTQRELEGIRNAG